MRELQSEAVAVLRATLAGTPLPKALARVAPTAPLPAIRDLCYQGLRHWGLIDAQVRALVPRAIKNEEVALLLRVALVQLQFTRAPAHAVVNTAVGLVADYRAVYARSMVNAVLRSFQRRMVELTSPAFAVSAGAVAELNFPLWWIDKAEASLGSAAREALKSQNAHPPFTVRVNLRRQSTADCAQALTAQGLHVQRIEAAGLTLTPARPVEDLPGFAEGRWSVQDAGAMLAAEFLDCRDGMRVLDSCAAPGGKTAHVLERHDVQMWALEVDPVRFATLEKTLDRLGLDAERRCADAADLPAWWDGRPFDRILLDAPCSASGTARRNPDIRWSRRADDLPTFIAAQRRLFAALWQTLAPGGKLLYATCSLFVEENRAQADFFLRTTPDARLIPIDHPALVAGQVIPDALRDGFFYALLEKQRT